MQMKQDATVIHSYDRMPFKLFGHPVSKRRVFTAAQSAVAVCLCCIPAVFTSAFPFLSQSIAFVGIINASIIMGLSHFAGTTSKNIGHLVAGGLVAALAGYPLSFLASDINRWLGVLSVFILTFIFSVFAGLWDPAFALMGFLKYEMFAVLVLVLYPPKVTPLIHPSVQLIFVHIYPAVVCMLVNLFTRSLPPQIVKEASVLIHNCGVALDQTINHIRFVKPTAPPGSPDSRRPFSLSDEFIAPDFDDLPSSSSSESESTRLVDNDAFNVEAREASVAMLKETEHVILRQLEYLRLMVLDCLQETWLGAELVISVRQLYWACAEAAQLIVALRLAVEDGFIARVEHSLIEPLKEHLTLLHDDLLVAVNAVASAASHCFEAPRGSENTTSVLEEINNQPNWYIRLKERAKTIFSVCQQLTRGFEESDTSFNAVPTPEDIRFSFVIYNIATYSDTLRSIDNAVNTIAQQAALDSSWRIVRSRIGIIVKPFTHLIGFIKANLPLFVPCMKSTQPSLKESLKAWSHRKGWRFPFGFTLAVTAVAALSVLLDNVSPVDLKTLWLCATTTFVSVLTLGASLRKAVHRIVGTIIAATLAQVLRFGIAPLVVMSAPPMRTYSGVVVLLIGLILGFVFTYSQHSSKYPKPYQWLVATFTFHLVFLLGYPYESATKEWYIGLLRLGHVIVGDLIATIAAYIFSERSFDSFKIIVAKATNAIHVPLVATVSSDVEAEQMHQECIDSLLVLSRAPKESKDLLKESKLEFKLRCVSSEIAPWVTVHSCLGPIASWMTSITRFFVFHRKFATKVHGKFMDSVMPLLRNAIELLLNDISIVSQALTDRSIDVVALPVYRYQTVFLQLHQAHYKCRVRALQKGKLHQYVRPLIHFNAFLFATQMFFEEWTRLVDAVNRMSPAGR